MAEIDLGLTLMESISSFLVANVPLTGGWHSTRLQTPPFPKGYIDLLSSTPRRGQGYYDELHRGVISIWTRGSDISPPSPREVMLLSARAHRLLGAAVLSTPGVAVLQFQCGTLTPQPDGSDWGRSFTFTAITHEVSNG